MKKFACFVETTPCVTNDGSTLHTCQSLCEEVRLKCGEEFKRQNIFFPQCIPNYPEIDAGNGLCHLSHWPVPWPAKLKQNPGLFHIAISCLKENDVTNFDVKLKFKMALLHSVPKDNSDKAVKTEKGTILTYFIQNRIKQLS